MSGHEEESGFQSGNAVPDERTGGDKGQADAPDVKGKDEFDKGPEPKEADGEPTLPGPPASDRD